MLSRMIAWLIDTLVIVGLVMVAAIVISMAAAATFAGFGDALLLIVYFLIDWGYFILLEAVWSGQTLGKKAMGLRVIQESGVRIGAIHAVLRNLARPVDRLPAVIPQGLYLAGPA